MRCPAAFRAMGSGSGLGCIMGKVCSVRHLKLHKMLPSAFNTALTIFVFFAVRCIDFRDKRAWAAKTVSLFGIWVAALVIHKSFEFCFGYPCFMDVLYWFLRLLTKGAMSLELYVTVILFLLGPTTIRALQMLAAMTDGRQQ